MKHLKHIFFDLDHTLWDFEKNSTLAFERIFEENKVAVQVADFMTVYNPINQDYWKLYQVNQVSHQELRYGRLKDTFDALGYSIKDELINQFSDDFIAYLPLNNHLIEGTIDTLNYLRDKYTLHIITNGFAYVQETKMTNSNLISYFKTITNSEMAGNKKPHASIFDFALNLAQANKNESVMIGDSWEADVMGALDYGIQAIYFNPERSIANKSVVEISKLIELKSIL